MCLESSDNIRNGYFYRHKSKKNAMFPARYVLKYILNIWIPSQPSSFNNSFNMKIIISINHDIAILTNKITFKLTEPNNLIKLSKLGFIIRNV